MSLTITAFLDSVSPLVSRISSCLGKPADDAGRASSRAKTSLVNGMSVLYPSAATNATDFVCGGAIPISRIGSASSLQVDNAYA
jgi:hypothetical protein